jgi:DNA-directed RNA polymerase subunit RPC12/RpoP
MRKSQQTASQQQINRPMCPRCGAQMWIARIEPDEPDHERRTFECPECNHSIIEVVQYK